MKTLKTFLLLLLLPFSVITKAQNLPIGYLDYVDQYSGSGWAYDEDAGTQAIDVHIYIDGRLSTTVTANMSRPDLVNAGVTPDPNHGYSFTITGIDLTRAHEIVVYAINYGGGANPPLTNCPAIIGTQPSGNASISNIAGPSNIVITTTQRLAGAIGSITWNGKEFIDSYDHGRELQSATSFDGLGECFNPTEAGSNQDGTGNTSTSFLQYLNASGNYLETQTLPAFWTQPGYTAPGCGAAVNTTQRSSHYFHKKVTIGMPGMAHVIEYKTEFDIPSGESYSSGTFEVATGYMPTEFSVFWNYNPANQQLTSLSDGPGEQEIPVIFSTTDNNYAMGVYSPDLPQSTFPSAGYGRFRFGDCTKWNCVFRETSVPSGTYKYRSYVIIGSLDNVETSMTQLYNYFRLTADFSANTVCVGTPTNFTDMTIGANSETIYQWDINNDGTIDYTTSGNFSHNFNSVGVFQVKLTVINGVSSDHYNSIIKNVVVLAPSATNLTETACENYTLNNQTYTTSGTYTQLLTNSNGCDSTITLNLTIKNSTNSIITETACENYTLNNQTYTTSGTYTQLLTNSNGCDSTITLNLTINNYPIVNLGNDTVLCINYGETSITLDASTAETYFWQNGTNSQFLTIDTSSYPLQINNEIIVIASNGNCSSTDTVFILFDNCTKISPNTKTNNIKIYPNPANNKIEIEGIQIGQIEIINLQGQIMKNINITNEKTTIDISKLSVGIYTIRIKNNEKIIIKKFVKE